MFLQEMWTLKWVSDFFCNSTDSNFGLATCQWRLKINNYYELEHRPWFASEIKLQQEGKIRAFKSNIMPECTSIICICCFKIGTGDFIISIWRTSVHWDHSCYIKEAVEERLCNKEEDEALELNLKKFSVYFSS